MQEFELAQITMTQHSISNQESSSSRIRLNSSSLIQTLNVESFC